MEGERESEENTDLIVSQLARRDKVAWYNKPNLRSLYLLMLPTCLGIELMTGFDASLINGLQAVPSWLEYFNHPRAASLGLMTSMYSLGSITAVPFVSAVVDKIGRRYPIVLGSVLSIVGSLLQGCALNFVMFVTARFLLGFANIFCVVAGVALIGELAHPKERAVMSSLFTGLWDLGALAAAATVLTTFAMTNNWGWRIPSLLQVLPSLCQLAFIWFIPESPRWLISKGRQAEALSVLVRYHAEGHHSDFVKAEFHQIEETLMAEMEVARMSKRAVFATPGMRKRALIATFLGLFTNMSGVGLISYYLPQILDSIGIHDNRMKNVINLAKVSWGFVNGIVLALIVPRFPRRTIYLTCAISVFIVFVAWTAASAEYALTQSNVAAGVVLALLFLYSPAYNSAFTALPFTFLIELFPFHVRTRGIALFQWWSRISLFFTQFINPIGIDAAGWKWYTVYCVWNAFQVGFVYVMFPETSGRTLEELTFLYQEDREILAGERQETYGTMHT